MSTKEISEENLNVLVVHALRPTSRQTTIDFLSSFKRHLPNCNVQYMNFFQPDFSRISEVFPDVLVVNYDFLNYRFSPLWYFMKDSLLDLASRSAFKIALTQDDFWGSDLLDDWIFNHSIDRVLSPIESNLDVLFPKSLPDREFKTVLTGYVNEDQKDKYFPKEFSSRSIDVGQRVRYPSPNLGSYGQEKAKVAERFRDIAISHNFLVDISTDVNESLIGQEWINFLCNSRYTVSMKGGASIVDKEGLLYARSASYLAKHPTASYADVKNACFRYADESKVFSAISPRLFEAAQARTCQILIESDYLGVLEPWVHYIPLKSDFSNSDQVLEAMKNHQVGERIADSCHKILIASGEFSDRRLVEAAFDSLPNIERNAAYSKNAWIELCDYQKELAFVQNIYSEEFSDTLILWLHDKWMREGSKSLKSLKARDLKDCFSHEGNAVDRTLIEASTDNEVSHWIDMRIEEILTGRCYPRLVWPWRQLPETETK